MASSSAQPFLWVGLTAALLLGAVVAINLLDSIPQPAPAAVDAGREEVTADPPEAPPLRARPTSNPAEAALLAGAEIDAPTPALAPTSRGLEIFREQVLEDQRHLGREFADLERLWKEGRYGGKSPRALEALEQLVDRYAGTHRAACASYLLARQRFGQSNGSAEERRGQAEQALRGLVDGDVDSRCDTGTRAVDLGKFFLATQVYRFTDWERSVGLLEELAEIDADAVDNLGVPLPLRARTILQEVESQRH